MNRNAIPSPQELEKELNEYLSKKYGDRVTLSVPLAFPNAESCPEAGRNTQIKMSGE